MLCEVFFIIILSGFIRDMNAYKTIIHDEVTATFAISDFWETATDKTLTSTMTVTSPATAEDHPSTVTSQVTTSTPLITISSTTVTSLEISSLGDNNNTLDIITTPPDISLKTRVLTTPNTETTIALPDSDISIQDNNTATLTAIAMSVTDPGKHLYTTSNTSITNKTSVITMNETSTTPATLTTPQNTTLQNISKSLGATFPSTTDAVPDIISLNDSNNSVDINSTSIVTISLENMPLERLSSTTSDTTISRTFPAKYTTVDAEATVTTRATDLSITNTKEVSDSKFNTSIRNKTSVTTMTETAVTTLEEQMPSILSGLLNATSQNMLNIAPVIYPSTLEASTETIYLIGTNNSLDVNSSVMFSTQDMPLKLSSTVANITSTTSSHANNTAIEAESSIIPKAMKFSVSDTSKASDTSVSTSITNKTFVTTTTETPTTTVEEQTPATLSIPLNTNFQKMSNTPQTNFPSTTDASTKSIDLIGTNNSLAVHSSVMITMQDMSLETLSSTTSNTTLMTTSPANYTMMEAENSVTPRVMKSSVSDTSKASDTSVSTSITNKTFVTTTTETPATTVEEQTPATLSIPVNINFQNMSNTPQTNFTSITDASPKTINLIDTNNNLDVNSSVRISTQDISLETLSSTTSNTTLMTTSPATYTMMEAEISVTPRVMKSSVSETSKASDTSVSTSTTNKTFVTTMTETPTMTVEEQTPATLSIPVSINFQNMSNTPQTNFPSITDASPKTIYLIGMNNNLDVNSSVRISTQDMSLETLSSTTSNTTLMTTSPATYTMMEAEISVTPRVMKSSVYDTNKTSDRSVSTSIMNKTFITTSTKTPTTTAEGQILATQNIKFQNISNTPWSNFPSITGASSKTIPLIGVNNRVDINSTSTVTISLLDIPLETLPSTTPDITVVRTFSTNYTTIGPIKKTDTQTLTSLTTPLNITSKNASNTPLTTFLPTIATPYESISLGRVNTTTIQEDIKVTSTPIYSILNTLSNTSTTATSSIISSNENTAKTLQPNRSFIEFFETWLNKLFMMSAMNKSSTYSRTTTTTRVFSTKSPLIPITTEYPILGFSPKRNTSFVTHLSSLTYKPYYTTEPNIIPNNTKESKTPDDTPSSTREFAWIPVKIKNIKKSDDLKTLLIVCILMVIITACGFISAYRTVKRNIPKVTPIKNSHNVDPEMPVYANQLNGDQIISENIHTETVSVQINQEVPLYAKLQRKNHAHNKKGESLYANQINCATTEEIPMQLIYANSLPRNQHTNFNSTQAGMSSINEPPKEVYAQIKPKRKRNLPIYNNVPTFMEPMTVDNNQPTYSVPHNN